MITVRHNLDQVRAHISAVKKAQRAAVESALNATAYEIAKKEFPAAMRAAFSNPTQFTLSAFMYHRAMPVAAGLLAQVVYKYNPGSRLRRHYLQVQTTGGIRPPKAIETLIWNKVSSRDPNFPRLLYPTKSVPRDAHGNVSRGFWNKVKADLQAASVVGDNSNRTARSTKRNKRYARERFFVSDGMGSLAVGIWLRTGKGSAERIVPVLLDAEDVRYTKRLDLERVHIAAVARHFPNYLARAHRNIKDGVGRRTYIGRQF